MRILKILVIMLVLTASLSYAEESSTYYTDNHINGRFWNRLDFTNKLYFLYGMVDGVTLISEAKPLLDEAANIRPAVSEMILKSTGRFFIPGGTYKDVVKFIDDFYSKDANLDMPVYSVYAEYLAKQKEWGSLNSWDDALKALRRE